MTVLTNISNGSSLKDVRDTLNWLIAQQSGAPTPTLSLSSAVTQAEGNTGTAAFVWTLTLVRNGSTASFPFNWAVAGSGTNPANAADFGGAFPTGTGTFAPGETTKTITVLVAGDTAVEPTETFLLSVSAAGLNTVTSTGTISNDDTAGPPALSARPTVDVFGESFGQYLISPGLHWACWAIYHADLTYNYRPYFVDGNGNGIVTPRSDPGNLYAVGQSDSTHFGGTQVPAAIARGVSEIGFTCVGLNDNPANSTEAAALANRITAGVQQLLNAGQKRHCIFEVFTKDPTANVINPILQQFADASGGRVVVLYHRDLLFSDTANLIWRGRTAAFGQMQTVFGGHSDDGIHTNGRGVRAVAPRIAAVLQGWGIAQITSLPTTVPSADFDSSVDPNASVLGRVGMIQGTLGIYNQATQPGTVAGFWSSGSTIFLTGQPGGMLTAAAIGAYNGFNEQRFTVGDVAGYNNVQMDFIPKTAANVNAGNSAARFRFCCVYRAINVTGLTSILVNFFNPSYNITAVNWATWGTSIGAAFDDNSSFELLIYSLGPVPLSGDITGAATAVSVVSEFNAGAGHTNAGQAGVSRADLRKIV